MRVSDKQSTLNGLFLSLPYGLGNVTEKGTMNLRVKSQGGMQSGLTKPSHDVA